MSLKPLLSVKVDELYQRWFTDPGTQLLMRENLAQLLAGESVSQILTVPQPRPVPGPAGLLTGDNSFNCSTKYL